MANPLVEGEDFSTRARTWSHREVPPRARLLLRVGMPALPVGLSAGDAEGRSGRSGRCRQKRELKGKGQRARKATVASFALSLSPFNRRPAADSSAPRSCSFLVSRHDVLDIINRYTSSPCSMTAMSSSRGLRG